MNSIPYSQTSAINSMRLNGVGLSLLNYKGKIMKNHQFTFSNKETYLEFRSAWKKEYAELSLMIRAQKQNIKVANRLFNPVENDYHFNNKHYHSHSGKAKIDLKPYWELLKNLENAQSNNLKSKEKARELMEILSQAKKEAQKQYQNRVISFEI